jgi:hypothetical protein
VGKEEKPLRKGENLLRKKEKPLRNEENIKRRKNINNIIS